MQFAVCESNPTYAKHMVSILEKIRNSTGIWYPSGKGLARALESGDYFSLCASLYNALYAPARTINSEAEEALTEALSFSPDGACMTGSGSAAFAVFQSEMLCRWAQSRYAGRFAALCAKTYQPKY